LEIRNMAVKPRTDDEKLSLAPIKVQLGGKPYEIPVRKILSARAWREQFIKSVTTIGTELKGDVTSVENFIGGFAFAFLQFPEKLADLVFAYAPDLPRDVIETDATEEELAIAFSAIMQVAFPFASELTMVSQVLKSATISPASPLARRTN
jgi:hypothetical protein